jgi:hypothetical protein
MRFPSFAPLVCLAAAVGLVASVPASAQPRVVNAQTSVHSAADGLQPVFQSLVDSQIEPAWIGYSVPATRAAQSTCCSEVWSSEGQTATCRLEGGASRPGGISTADRVELEGPKAIVVLYRVEDRRVGRIRFFSESCQLDAGGLPFRVLNDVRTDQSVALLESFARQITGDRKQDGRAHSALASLSFHADPSADRVLERLAGAGSPERLREQAIFWLGTARGRTGYEALLRLLEQEKSPRIRERLTFAFYVSSERDAVDTLVTMARNDPQPRVRGQALFWLARKAGQKAVGELTHAVQNDPETEVRKRAVFGLAQLPKDQGVPLLIQVARSNPDGEVRKQAIFWLGQSRDDRALAFFEEILGLPGARR